MSLAAIIFVSVAPMGGVTVFWWGFNNYPKTTALVLAIILVCLVTAALSYKRLFPTCNAYSNPFHPGVTVCSDTQSPTPEIGP